jgi:hypothetical protein
LIKEYDEVTEPAPIEINLNIRITLGQPHSTDEHTDEQVLHELAMIRNTGDTWHARQDENGDWHYIRTDGQGARDQSFMSHMERTFHDPFFQAMVLDDLRKSTPPSLDYYVI